MSILVPEIASKFYALDSAVYEDGGPVDAHVLRTLGQAANRLLAAGEPLLNVVWDAGDDAGGELQGAFYGWGWPLWVQILPGPLTRPKKPGTTRATAIVRFRARLGETLYVCFQTARAPLVSSLGAGASNVLTLTGTGAIAEATLEDIPIDEGDVEYVTAWLRGVPSSTTGNTATYGSPASGSISQIIAPDLLEDTGATWNIAGSTWATGGHCVAILDAAGNEITEPRWIVRVASSTTLRVFPAFDPGFVGQSLNGADYKIFELPQWRINQIALYAQDREA